VSINKHKYTKYITKHHKIVFPEDKVFKDLDELKNQVFDTISRLALKIPKDFHFEGAYLHTESYLYDVPASSALQLVVIHSRPMNAKERDLVDKNEDRINDRKKRAAAFSKKADLKLLAELKKKYDP
jgi:asparagine synthetase B (glutamine-hydrolysing)